MRKKRLSNYGWHMLTWGIEWVMIWIFWMILIGVFALTEIVIGIPISTDLKIFFVGAFVIFEIWKWKNKWGQWQWMSPFWRKKWTYNLTYLSEKYTIIIYGDGEYREHLYDHIKILDDGLDESEG